MSDTSQGPGWWQASDGKWYAPELYPSIPPVPTRPSRRLGLWFAIAAVIALFVGLVATRQGGSSHASNTTTTTTTPITTTSRPQRSTSTTATTTTTTSATTTTTDTVPTDYVDPVSLIGLEYGDPLLERALTEWGCLDYFVPGPMPSSGIECFAAGTLISLDMSTTVSSVGMVNGSSGFATYAGELPAGLRWGMSLDDVNNVLTSRWGSPLNTLEGGGDIGPSEDFVTTGEAYGGMQVEFSATTYELVRVSVERDAPIPWPP